MRLPPVVVSLIESHLGLPPSAVNQCTAKQASFKAFAANLQPFVPGRSSTCSSPATTSTRPTTSALYPTRRALKPRRLVSLEEALERYATKPQIALAAAHRLLNEQHSAPSTSSRVDYILKRQNIYETIIKIFASYSDSAKVTIASTYQRMVDEDIPPTSEILKIVLGTALKNGTPIIPILRGMIIGNVGLPEEVDSHLLLLVIKGLVREVVIEPKDLDKIIDDCIASTSTGVGGKGELKCKERPIGFDEMLVESYGRKGDQRGMINVLSRHTQTTSTNRGILRLYLQALTQWIQNPLLRQKRRGSLFPRALAKDLITIYGGAENLPLEWLNAWMNGERIANNLKTALNVWQVIQSSGIRPDATTYLAYLRLIKLLPFEDGHPRLREVVKNLLDPTRTPNLDSELLEHSLGAAFAHNDTPLVVLLTRQLDFTPDQHLKSRITPSARVIDILAAGLIRSQRSTTASESRKSRSSGISIEEWGDISYLVKSESGIEVSLPLHTPLAGLVAGYNGGEFVGQFKPRSQTQSRASLVKPLLALLEQVITRQHGAATEGEVFFRETMKQVNAEVLT